MDDELEQLRYEHLDVDHCIYVRQGRPEVAMAAIHVDDMQLGAMKGRIEGVKKEIGMRFNITDLGETRQIVGIQAEPDDETDRLIHPYQSVIRSLMYAVLGMRSDIAYAVQHLSQFCSALMQMHWTTVKCIMRYLNGTLGVSIKYGLHAKVQDLELIGYSDADWAEDANDCKSVSGYVFLFSGSPITWSSKKQLTIALSSMEAEYMAMSHAAREVLWLRNLLTELDIVQKSGTLVNVDNQGAIAYSKLNIFHRHSKHIDIWHHFIHDCIEVNEVKVIYCATNDNIADLFTKPLARERHEELIRLLAYDSGDCEQCLPNSPLSSLFLTAPTGNEMISEDPKEMPNELSKTDAESTTCYQAYTDQLNIGKATAQEMWTQLRDDHSKPGLAAIYAEFKSTIDLQIPANQNPAPPIAKLQEHIECINTASKHTDILEFIHRMLLTSKALAYAD
ncbi:hypothetical protein NM688_g454 [Phlebia brevispora]|uniref:Uncharacterized protein n=1 Tax=Phlebia brevispora TaxID=194682 RepID=A0ACC1TEK0_9APHY|nr:hypothetical protein NM688_g454 [Phlebia brevispora]